MKIRSVLLAAVLAGSFALAACGSDDKSSEAAEEQATPQQAIDEIGEVEGALDTALTQVKAGDTAAAKETVSEAYVDHFEKVEGPLGKVDEQLNEELEEAISTELREKIESGASAAEIEKLIGEIKANLATAKGKL
jgi:type IV pilus biogenesis protein CpaD/CtpE